MNQVKQYYHLAAGHVFFHDAKAEGDIEVGSTHLNAVVVTQTGNITSQDLGRAQQALQIQLHNRMPHTEVKVVDVVFSGIIALGHMTPDEFLCIPADDAATAPTVQ